MIKHRLVPARGNLIRLLVLATLAGSVLLGSLVPQIGMEITLFLLLGLVGAVAIHIDPANAIYLMILMSFLGLASRVNTALPGLPTLFMFLSGMTAAAYLARQALNPRPFYLTGVYVPLVGFAVTAVVSAMLAGHPHALGWARGYVLRVLLVVLTINVLHDSRSIITLARLTASGSAFAAITTLMDVVVPGWTGSSGVAEWRAVGVNEPGYTGFYLIIGLPFMIYLRHHAPSTTARRLLDIAIVIQMAALAAVQVRSVTLGAVVVLFMLLFLKRRHRPSSVVWVAIFSFLVFSAVFSQNIRRFAPVVDFARTGVVDYSDTYGTRLAAWAAAFHLFQRSPLLGVGPGMFQVLGSKVALVYLGPNVPAHSIFVDFLAELGIVGFACWLSVFVLAARCLNQCITLAADSPLGPLAGMPALARASFWGMVAFGLFQPMQNEVVLWIMLAFPFALRKIIRARIEQTMSDKAPQTE